MSKLMKKTKRLFWKLPVPSSLREQLRLHYATIKEKNEKQENKNISLRSIADLNAYTHQVLTIPTARSEQYRAFKKNKPIHADTRIIAYYLTQFHPNIQNDNWWGKGTTEWTNVSKAVPQYPGHYQPRLPGELGYYDLRLRENMQRQIELAKNYGVNTFCFYYYWFDGKRLLERPMNMFLQDKTLDIEFCICWANENWTKRFSGTNTDILMKVGETSESCINFIYNILNVLNDERYYCINEKPVLVIYRPSMIKNTREVLSAWRKIIFEHIQKELYIIAVQEKGDDHDWCHDGYDAETEFQPKRINNIAKDITEQMGCIRKDFQGAIYDYEDLVRNRKYVICKNTTKKVYPAVMPMWDNTARRNNKGLIYHGSSPELYGMWLKDAIHTVQQNTKIEDNAVFINAWNEWGEGAYLEPDRYWGYAYLEATYKALEESQGC